MRSSRRGSSPGPATMSGSSPKTTSTRARRLRGAPSHAAMRVSVSTTTSRAVARAVRCRGRGSSLDRGDVSVCGKKVSMPRRSASARCSRPPGRARRRRGRARARGSPRRRIDVAADLRELRASAGSRNSASVRRARPLRSRTPLSVVEGESETTRAPIAALLRLSCARRYAHSAATSRMARRSAVHGTVAA